MFTTWKVDRETSEIHSIRHAFDPVSARSSQHQACNRCHIKKLKCSGEKDGCDRCAAIQVKCGYSRCEARCPRRRRPSAKPSASSPDTNVTSQERISERSSRCSGRLQKPSQLSRQSVSDSSSPASQTDYTFATPSFPPADPGDWSYEPLSLSPPSTETFPTSWSYDVCAIDMMDSQLSPESQYPDPSCYHSDTWHSIPPGDILEPSMGLDLSQSLATFSSIPPVMSTSGESIPASDFILFPDPGPEFWQYLPVDWNRQGT